MDLKQLQYFVVSVESGSFKKAAEMLYTTQPHISKSIKNLETELNVQLLERKARGVEVTESGKRFMNMPAICWWMRPEFMQQWKKTRKCCV